MSWLRRFMEWWHRPAREKRAVQQGLTRYQRILKTYRDQDQAVRR